MLGRAARFPDLRRCLLPAPSHLRCGANSGMRRVSYRLQLPGRSGLSPLSLHPLNVSGVDKKIPDSHERAGESYGHYPSHSPLGESLRELALGRSSGLRITLLAAPSRPARAGGCSGFRSRLQRRGRDGFLPSSLVFPLRKHPLPICRGDCSLFCGKSQVIGRFIP